MSSVVGTSGLNYGQLTSHSWVAPFWCSVTYGAHLLGEADCGQVNFQAAVLALHGGRAYLVVPPRAEGLVSLFSKIVSKADYI